MSEKEFDMVGIPSAGLLYDHPELKNKEALEVFYMTTRHEDILTSPNLMASGEVLDVLLKSIMVNKKIDVHNLLPGDRDAILVWARATGFGADYTFSIKCPACGSVQEDTMNLNEIGIISLDENETFEFKMPLSGKIVKFGFITYGQQKEISDTIARKKKKLKVKIDDRTTLTLLQSIKAVDGDSEPDSIRKFVNKMRPGDSRALLKHTADKEPRLDMSYDFECAECSHIERESSVPVTVSFWWN